MDNISNMAKCASGECQRRGWQTCGFEKFICWKFVNLNLNKKWLPVKKEVVYKKILSCTNTALAVDPSRYLDEFE
jgi:hypothetical protein